MRGTDKCKVVTSGRLTGGVRAQLSRRRGTQDPGPAASPEPGYSLHSTSTDSGEQVSSLHKGLDRCAALLTDILQAEKTEALPSLPRAVTGRAAEKTPCSSLRKKPISNTKTDQRGRKPVQPVPCTTTRPHAVKLHPPEKPTSIHPPEKPTSIHPPEKQTSIHPPEKQTSIHPPQTPIHPPQTPIHPPQTPNHPPQTSIHPPQTPNHPPQTPVHPPQTSIHPPQTPIHPPQTPNHPPQTSIHPSNKHTSIHHPQTSIHPGHPQTSISYTDCKAECDKKEEEFVPVRDINVQSSAVRQTCTLKVSDMQLKLGPVENVPQDSHSGGECSAETDVKVKTPVQYLLGELKTLIAGQGSAAERLLSHLEQTVSSPLMAAGSSNIRTEPELLSLHSQNTQLRRRVRILSQQLKQRGRAETHQSLEMLLFSLQEEISTAQALLQELQEDVIGLRKALKDTQSRLTDKEAERALIQTDLEATRLRLLDSEREKREMASLAQQRLEDIRNLNRILQCHDSFIRPPVVNRSVSNAEQRLNLHRPDPDEPPTDRISQFLMPLGQLQPPPTEHVCVSAEREQRTLRDTLAHPDVRPPAGDPAGDPDAPLDPSHGLQDVKSCVQERLSRCNVESVRSDRSTRSGSTFNTRGVAAFRDGLAAVDASIASLRKTIQLDLGRRC